jgi:hypothetical protein
MVCRWKQIINLSLAIRKRSKAGTRHKDAATAGSLQLHCHNQRCGFPIPFVMGCLGNKDSKWLGYI